MSRRQGGETATTSSAYVERDAELKVVAWLGGVGTTEEWGRAVREAQRQQNANAGERWQGVVNWEGHTDSVWCQCVCQRSVNRRNICNSRYNISRGMPPQTKPNLKNSNGRHARRAAGRRHTGSGAGGASLRRPPAIRHESRPQAAARSVAPQPPPRNSRRNAMHYREAANGNRGRQRRTA